MPIGRENEKIMGEVYPKMTLSINATEGRIRIGQGVARALGFPEYICFYISKNNDGLLVRPSEKKEFLSIKVGRNRNNPAKDDLRVYSLSFVTGLYEQNGWELRKTYQIIGKYIQEWNAVFFSYVDAV